MFDIKGLLKDVRPDLWAKVEAGIPEFLTWARGQGYHPLNENFLRWGLARMTLVHSHKEKSSYGYQSGTRVVIGRVCLPGGEKTDQYDDTVLHEAAHLVASYACGHNGHGKPWKVAAEAVGARPERCGPWFGPPKVKAVVYQCTNCGHKVHRSRRWSRSYVHPPCRNTANGGHLVLVAHPTLDIVSRAA